MVTMLAIMMPLMEMPASATTAVVESGFGPCYGGRVYRVRRPNVYQRNRAGFNALIGAGVGVLAGSMIDGKRGALIGGGAGAAGGLIYTYIRNRRTGRCQRVYRRG